MEDICNQLNLKITLEKHLETQPEQYYKSKSYKEATYHLIKFTKVCLLKLSQALIIKKFIMKMKIKTIYNMKINI